MARTVQITVPRELTDELIAELRGLSPVAGIRLQPNQSVMPKGDVISMDVPNGTLPAVMRLLQERGIGRTKGTSYTLAEPVALVEESSASAVLGESTDAPWEEMHQVLARESNMTINALALMALAGAVAMIGIASGALHVVIAAMVIAPGFEPISRVALGLVAGGPALGRGLVDSLKAYAALAVGAAVMTALLPTLGRPALDGEGTYLSSESLVSYWTSSDSSALVLSTMAAFAGAILIATNRTVLTAGVMIGLALIPAGSLAVAGLVAGDLEVSGRALARWSLDVLLVLATSLLVFWWKRSSVHKRRAHL